MAGHSTLRGSIPWRSNQCDATTCGPLPTPAMVYTERPTRSCAVRIVPASQTSLRTTRARLPVDFGVFPADCTSATIWMSVRRFSAL
jgi:hypothetical protein